jgi:hypothetical protein
MFLHYAFDAWMARTFPTVQFERYCDDIIVHARSERQARYLRDVIARRLAECGRELNEHKTRIVYCKDDDRRGSHKQTSFDFLGYTFRPRLSRNKLPRGHGVRHQGARARHQRRGRIRALHDRPSALEGEDGVVHIDEDLDFLGWHPASDQAGHDGSLRLHLPPKKALRAVMEKVRTLTRQGSDLSLTVLLHRLNPVLRGWTNYFRPGVSSATFQYHSAFTWRRVIGWLRRKHPRITWKQLRRSYCPNGWRPTEDGVALFNTAAVRTSRYGYRGTAIPTPWPSAA